MVQSVRHVVPWVLLAVSGCVTVSKSVLVDRSDMPVPLEDVYVFLPGDVVPEDCERVAILSAEGDEDLTDQAEMIDKMREETGKLGGNALLLEEVEEPGLGERVLAAVTETSAERRASAQSLWCPSRAEGPTLR